MAKPAWARGYSKKKSRRKAWWQSSPKRKGRGFRIFGIRFF